MASREARQKAIKDASRRAMSLRGAPITAAMGDLVNVENIEVVQTGLEYKLASGPRTFTVDDLHDAVESQNDAAIKAPRLKLGHTANIGLLEDGQPAIGTLGNMRLEKNGHLVLADYVGIPEWLAKVLPSAYPARSIEALTGVKTNTGNQWKMVITDLALLGVVWPGVSTLDDIKALYSKDGPDSIQILTTKQEVEDMANGQSAAAGSIQAQVNNDDILRQYREQKTPDQMWWWVHAMMRDPDELIVEDEEHGQLYRIPYAIKGEIIEFSEPVPVKIVFKDKKVKKQESTKAARAELSMVLAAGDREGFNRMTIASGMDPVALRNALGLEDDATDDEVKAALASAGYIMPPGQESSAPGRAAGSEQPGTNDAGAATPPSSSTQPDVENSGESRNNPATAQPTVVPPAPVAASSSDIMRVDRATLDQLRADAALGRQAHTRLVEGDRDQIIEAAIASGKIMPSRREHWQRKWAADEQEVRTLLTAAEDKGGLAPGVIPIEAKGNSSSTEDTSADAYPTEWLPEVHNQASKGGVTSDG